MLALERQATSKILDVDDIERIDTLGFRGEAIPSIASVSRLSITTRRKDSDEGTRVVVNAGTLVETCAAGCPPGTLVEVRDLFCNVPARRKFLRSQATEESHVKAVFTLHALAHPSIGFTLEVDGREVHRLAPSEDLADRVRDLFGLEFTERLSPIPKRDGGAVSVSGFVERPNSSAATRREQYVFVNGRPASAPPIAYALKEAYPSRAGDSRPAVILFINLPPTQVDVNVHPTKKEVRFRDNASVRQAVMAAVEAALNLPSASVEMPWTPAEPQPSQVSFTSAPFAPAKSAAPAELPIAAPSPTLPIAAVEPVPVQDEIRLEVSTAGANASPWRWFKFLAQSESGYLLIETDAGIVTINPVAARERITYERLLRRSDNAPAAAQALLIPETVRLSPVDFARIKASLGEIRAMGFQLEEFGLDTFKIDAVPQAIGTASPSAILSTVAHDLSESGARRGGGRWREELIAKSVARSFAGASAKLDRESGSRLVEELCGCRMPYVCPRGKPVMIFTSTRELDRRFDKA